MKILRSRTDLQKLKTCQGGLLLLGRKCVRANQILIEEINYRGRREHAANEIENCSWMQVFFWWLEFEKINYFIFLCKKLVLECGHSGGNEMNYFSLIKYENGRFQFICM